MLVKLASLPQRHFKSTCLCRLLIFVQGLSPVSFEHILLDALAGLIGGSKVRRVHFSFSIVGGDFLVELGGLILVPYRDKQVLFVELYRLELGGGLKHLGIFFSRDHALMGLRRLLAQ